MKNYKLIIGSFLLSVLFLGFVRFDDEPLKKLLQQIEKYRLDYPQEKVHLHMDKPYYAIGDDIWFKAYVVNSEKNQLTGLSQILYVELINDKDSVKKSLRLPLTYGLAWGDFALTDSLQEGNYRIRAYTTWMRNFSEDYFFDKTFTVGNSISNKVLTDVKYSYSKDVNGERVEADITYTDLRGVPLVNKEVSYNVILDFRNIANGKGITDTNGKLSVNFVNAQPFILKSGKIQTTIKLDENKSATKTLPVKSTSNESDVQFFPESGNLVKGLPSKVGFKAVNADGLGIPVSGYISAADGTKLTEFKSEHAGMGKFAFRPQAVENYTATVVFEDGSEKSYPLPAVSPNGYILSADNLDNDEQLHIKVLTTEFNEPNAQFTLIAQSNGNVLYVSKTPLKSMSFSASLPKSRFPTGILQLTLFSDKNQPVAERMVFINHQDFLDLNIKTPKTTYSKREKVQLDIQASNPEGKPVVGSFSIAVTDEAKIPFDDNKETTILSNLLLSSDLKGFVENPNYYFHVMDRTRASHLDNLLLTQGWRRFEWKNIMNNSFPNLAYQPEKNMRVSGRVKAANGKPVVNGAVTLFSSSGDVFLIDTVTNENGEFVFENLYFNDSTKFIVQARNEKDRKNVEIQLDRIPPHVVTKNKNEAMLEVNVNSSILPYLKNSLSVYETMRQYGLLNRSIMLDEVMVVEKKPAVNNSSNLNGAGNADNVIKGDVLQNCFDITICLQGRVPGIVVRNGIVYSTRSMNSSFSGPVPMQIILDGMFVEPEFLSAINPNDIETIEVLRSISYTAIYGMRGGGGVLVINTKRGERTNSMNSYAPGIISFKPQGFYTARSFYQPKYDDPETRQDIPDHRTTVYWNPNVITDSTGIAKVEFFNADGVGAYKVVVEGLDVNGVLGRKVFRYNVN